MADRSSIEWCDATWNPVTGCTEVSPGCDHCYARTFAERWRGVPGHHFERGFDVVLRPERLDEPLRWRKPRRVFVNSMSDLFHDAVSDTFIARAWAVMAATPQHTYQILTKRHGRMRSLVSSAAFRRTVADWLAFRADRDALRWLEFVAAEVLTTRWPLPNVWLGVSVEDQKRADLRVPALLDTPAAVRFLSCEPLIGPVNLASWLDGRIYYSTEGFLVALDSVLANEPPAPDWVIVGGESGPGARPMHPDWARSLRDQCRAVGVSFFFKQWGEWAPAGFGIGLFDPPERLIGPPLDDLGHRQIVRRVGKKAAGRVLDGRTWEEFPQAAATRKEVRK